MQLLGAGGPGVLVPGGGGAERLATAAIAGEGKQRWISGGKVNHTLQYIYSLNEASPWTPSLQVAIKILLHSNLLAAKMTGRRQNVLMHTHVARETLGINLLEANGTDGEG